MESEKVKEIKKALECCQDRDCRHCPRIEKEPLGEKGCRLFLLTDILTLINELESEKERLHNAKVVYETVDYCAKDLRKAQDRIVELEKENARLNKLFTYDKSVRDRCFEFIKDIKEEALKQFAEMLIEKKVKLGDRFNIFDIYETLKECING